MAIKAPKAKEIPDSGWDPRKVLWYKPTFSIWLNTKIGSREILQLFSKQWVKVGGKAPMKDWQAADWASMQHFAKPLKEFDNCTITQST